MNAADRYIERVKRLPPAPAIVTRLLGLFGDPNREIDHIVELISYDPSLTAEVLKRCNSAFFRGTEPAADIFEAVTRLGFFEVYSVVAALVGARSMSMGKAGAVIDTNVLWRHSVTTAVASAALARRAVEPEAPAYTAGLLHDIGKLVLAAAESSVYAGVLQQAGIGGPALLRAETAELGVNHAEIGARLLTRWGLPPSLPLAVLHHHNRPRAAGSFERLVAAVHLGNLMAHHLDDNTPLVLDGNPAVSEAATLMRIKEDDLPDLLLEVSDRATRVQKSI